MRIAFVDFIDWDYKVESAYQRPLGGSQSALCYLAEALAQQGHEVFVFNYTSSPGLSRGVICIPLDSMSEPLLRGLDFAIILNGSTLQAKGLRAILGYGTPIILWTQHAHDQPAVQTLYNPKERDEFDGFALISHWQREQFHQHFSIDLTRVGVLRNAISPAFAQLFSDPTSIGFHKSQPPILAYTSTPFRGLHILVDVFPQIRHAVPGTRLKVFSSMKVYQLDGSDDESKYGQLYRQCQETEGVEYIGSLPQPELAGELKFVTTLAYPNTFAETSCIAVMEALASGCHVVTSDLGALPETTAGFGSLIPITGDWEAYKQLFVDEVVRSLQVTPETKTKLREQVDYINTQCTWSVRAREWVQWLEQIQTHPLLPFTAAKLSLNSRTAYQFFLKANYSDAIAAYEKAIEENPTELSNYWYLGLTQILQGEEEAAQATWLSVMMEAEPIELEEWTAELVKVLETEADRQISLEDDRSAWIIRQHIREIAPDNLENLLQLIQQSLALEITEDLEVVLSDALDLLQREETSNFELCWQTLHNLLEFAPDFTLVSEFTKVCVDRLKEDRSLVNFAIEKTSEPIRENTLTKTKITRFFEIYHQLQPENISILVNLINLYQDTGRYTDSLKLTEQFLSRADTLLDKIAGYYLKIRGLLNSGGKIEEAYKSHKIYQKLLFDLIASANPRDLKIDENHLFNLISTISFLGYLEDSPRQVNLFKQDFSLFWQSEVKKYFPSIQFDRSSDDNFKFQGDRILKIGYISGCLTRHSIGSLSRWVFQHHDLDRFQVYGYSLTHTDDEIQQNIQSSVSIFCDFSQGQTIPEIAELIYQDEIDILVDLDSLTSNISCAVMALKPAPIQVTWLGFDAAEIPSIDYLIADSYVLPDSAQDYYSETIWRLPETYIAVDGFEVGVPTLRREQLDIPTDAVVYFSSQTGAKRHPDNVRLQMRILKEVPNSYFLIKGLHTDTELVKSFFEEIAAEEGVELTRLRFLPNVPSEAVHRANLGIADVVLDTYPYNGTTTTLETLWMGVPVVTRVGQQFASRQGYTLLMNVGVTEGIAWTDEQYVEWGVRLGKDAALRQEVSWKLRMSRHSSPLWKAEKFTRDLEDAYRQMWEMYLKS